MNTGLILVHLFYAKSKSERKKELSDLIFIPQMKKSLSYYMTFPDFNSLPRAADFHIQVVNEIGVLSCGLVKFVH